MTDDFIPDNQVGGLALSASCLLSRVAEQWMRLTWAQSTCLDAAIRDTEATIELLTAGLQDMKAARAIHQTRQDMREAA